MEPEFLSVDDYINNQEKIAKEPDFIQDDENDVIKKSGANETDNSDAKDLPKLASTSDSLTKNARKALEYYLRKSPQVRVLDKQIELLQAEALKYKAEGKKELFQKTQDMLIVLTKNRQKFVKIYKQNNYKTVKTESDIKIKNSDELKEFKERQKLLEKQFRETNPNSLISRLNEYRDLLEKNSFEPVNFDEDSIVDIDEVLDNPEEEQADILSEKQIPIDKKYRKLCLLIADKLEITPAEVDNTKSSVLLKMLKAITDPQEILDIRNELDNVKFEASNEIAKLRGNEDITNIMFEIFDFETVPEQQPKEMLAASNVGYVKAVAYSNCIKLNMLHNLDDAVAYGLMGLSVAIDKWYNIQKMKDSAVSFNGFAHLYIVNNIKKGLYELGSGGVLNKNSIATFAHKRAKAMDAFIQSNPDLKDIPKDMLETFVESSFENIGHVMTEGSYTDMIGGDEGGDSDIWANAASSNLNDEKFLESKMEYENLIKSIKALFSLFETKTREDGSKFNTKWKLFNKYEYKLFKLAYGLEYKTTNIDGKTTVKDNYNQTEIAEIMQNFYRANGATNKTFTQGGINYQLKQLEEKIKASLDEHPQLKAGFEYIYNYWAANSQDMSLMSNSREKLDIEFVDESLKGKSEVAQQQIENDLFNGKRLSTISDSTDYNPLDEELAEAFRNF